MPALRSGGGPVGFRPAGPAAILPPPAPGSRRGPANAAHDRRSPTQDETRVRLPPSCGHPSLRSLPPVRAPPMGRSLRHAADDSTVVPICRRRRELRAWSFYVVRLVINARGRRVRVGGADVVGSLHSLACSSCVNAPSMCGGHIQYYARATRAWTHSGAALVRVGAPVTGVLCPADLGPLPGPLAWSSAPLRPSSEAKAFAMARVERWSRHVGTGIGLSGHKNQYRLGVCQENWVRTQASPPPTHTTGKRSADAKHARMQRQLTRCPAAPTPLRAGRGRPCQRRAPCRRQDHPLER